jgi:hypothetical protein
MTDCYDSMNFEQLYKECIRRGIFKIKEGEGNYGKYTQ